MSTLAQNYNKYPIYITQDHNKKRAIFRNLICGPTGSWIGEYHKCDRCPNWSEFAAFEGKTVHLCLDCGEKDYADAAFFHELKERSLKNYKDRIHDFEKLLKEIAELKVINAELIKQVEDLKVELSKFDNMSESEFAFHGINKEK